MLAPVVTGVMFIIFTLMYITPSDPNTRSSMLEVIRQDYIRTARAKGQNEAVIIAITFSLVNLVVDILYGFVDPRVRSQYK